MEIEDLESLLRGETLSAALKANAGTGPSLRERFRRAMFFQEVSPLPNFEFGYWDRTLEVWRLQGLPDWVDDEITAYDYFGIESWVMVPVDCNPLAPYEYEILEETEDRLIYRDPMGWRAQINKKGDKSIPQYLEFPIKDRASWEAFKPALDPMAPERWERSRPYWEMLRESRLPVGVYAGSLMGVPRNLMGFHAISTLPYEDPELFEDIVSTFGGAIVAVLQKALKHVQVDFAMGWEDICFNNGPIIAPEVVRAVVGPWYRRISDTLIAHGCCIYTTDTDGDINALAPIFLENGLNTMFPVEVHAGSDPCALRRRFGERIRLWGGVNKRKVAESKDAIRAELMRLKPYVEQGGFIPAMDHRVPADIPLDNYKYYLDLKRELLGVGGEPKY